MLESNHQPSIVTSGRLGNQLFQWAFMHRVADSNAGTLESTFAMLEMNLPTNGQRNLLKPLMMKCPHFRIQNGNKCLELRMRGVQKLNTLLPSSAIAKISSILHLQYESTTPYGVLSYLKPATYIGYFQDVRWFSSFLPTILGELHETLDAYRQIFESSLPQKLQSPFNLLHIRGGDYKQIENSGFGLLDSSYFLDNLDSNLPSIIITDDEEYAYYTTVRYIPNAFLLSPRNIDAYLALSLSSLCERFIGSNSTFSYWCALLANFNGATVLLPSPFNRDGVNLNTLRVSGLDFVQANYI